MTHKQTLRIVALLVLVAGLGRRSRTLGVIRVNSS